MRKILHFRIADLGIAVGSELPFAHEPFEENLRPFQVHENVKKDIHYSHRFFFPDLPGEPGRLIHKKGPWLVYDDGDSTIYFQTSVNNNRDNPILIGIFNRLHTRGEIFRPNWKHSYFPASRSLSTFPTDQILIGRALPFFGGMYLHAAGAIMNGRGLLFLGHSGAGKSTILKLLGNGAEILCDDRIIIRNHSGKFLIHGTWSHGEIPTVSPGKAPLLALFFPEKAGENRIIPMKSKKEILFRLLKLIIMPVISKEWWEKILELVDDVVSRIPAFTVRFDKSGKIRDVLENFTP